MSLCPCGSKEEFSNCCEPYLKGAKISTAEACMRARYTAFVMQDIPFLRSSLTAESQKDYDEESIKQWVKIATWKELSILKVAEGDTPNEAFVEFSAMFEQQGYMQTHHETGYFKNVDGSWLYENGEIHAGQPVRRESPKVGRNDACPCGSGKKFKKCCSV